MKCSIFFKERWHYVLCSLMFLCFGAGTLFAQDQKIGITGSVLDEMGQPLPGANVVEQGTTNGVSTDFDGMFSIGVSDPDAVLEISYIGYQNQEIELAG